VEGVVVHRVPRRVDGDQRAAAHLHPRTVFQHHQPVGRHGRHLAPQRVHALAVEPRGARQQPRGIGQVRPRARVSVHLRARGVAEERPRPARVVQVHVRHQQVRDLLGRAAQRPHRAEQRR
jgi:hypothetical protein